MIGINQRNAIAAWRQAQGSPAASAMQIQAL
jgi:hypothetical protein